MKSHSNNFKTFTHKLHSHWPGYFLLQHWFLSFGFLFIYFSFFSYLYQTFNYVWNCEIPGMLFFVQLTDFDKITSQSSILGQLIHLLFVCSDRLNVPVLRSTQRGSSNPITSTAVRAAPPRSIPVMLHLIRRKIPMVRVATHRCRDWRGGRKGSNIHKGILNGSSARMDVWLSSHHTDALAFIPTRKACCLIWYTCGHIYRLCKLWTGQLSHVNNAHKDQRYFAPPPGVNDREGLHFWDNQKLEVKQNPRWNIFEVQLCSTEEHVILICTNVCLVRCSDHHLQR